MLMEYDESFKNGIGLGKIIFGLVDIPIGKKYLTSNGNMIERIDSSTVLLVGENLVDWLNLF